MLNNEDQVVKITCTDNGVSATAEVYKHHPNGDITMILEKTMKMHFKKYNGNVWTCEMLGREYVYDIRQQDN